MPLLAQEFYQGDDVVALAKAMLGKIIYTDIWGCVTAGRIIETEAYSYREKGCHAYNLKKTSRNAAMFEPGGICYVYLCYGIHEMFNIVTNKEGLADAVLVRAIQPLVGVETIKDRRRHRDCNGPGKVTEALGISRIYNGLSLYTRTEIWIEDSPSIDEKEIIASSRIGIDYAGEDAHLPWRFTIIS